MTFDSPIGRCEVDLAELRSIGSQKRFDFGGLGLQVCIERYPEQVTDDEAALTATIEPPAGQTTPYFVKVVQVDGHMAWSSPIYVTSGES